MTTELNALASIHCFDGQQQRFSHFSDVLGCEMQCSIFLPSVSKSHAVPVLYWLSGLTCNDENFVQKAGAQRMAEELGLAIVTPDTSPRGDHVADDPDAAYDFGLGAGFYLDATQQPWATHYKMYSYITAELPQIIAAHFPIDPTRQAISGHSMGGHGALTIALKNPNTYASVSAFAPICAPINCAWGQKALTLYLGDQAIADNKAAWAQYDTCALIKQGLSLPPTLVHQGLADDFYPAQLNTKMLADAVRSADLPVQINLEEGYDHSYFFIASFIEEHLRFHAAHLFS